MWQLAVIAQFSLRHGNQQGLESLACDTLIFPWCEQLQISKGSRIKLPQRLNCVSCFLKFEAGFLIRPTSQQGLTVGSLWEASQTLTNMV